MKRVSLNSLLARLLIGAGIPLVLFVGVALVGLISIHRLHTSLGWVEHTREIMLDTMRMKESINLAQRGHRDMMRLEFRIKTRGPATQAQLRELDLLQANYLNDRNAFLTRHAVLRLLLSDSPTQLERLHLIREQDAEWLETAERFRQKFATTPKAEMIEEHLQTYLDASTAANEKFSATTDALIGVEDRLLVERTQEANDLRYQSFALIGAVGGLGLVIAALTVLVASRSVTRPIHRLVQATNQLMAGKFEVVPVTGPDEIVKLTGRFNHMQLLISQRTSLLEAETVRYAQYLSATANLLWTTNAQGEVTDDMPTWAAYTGQTVEQMQGTGWMNAIHPEDRDYARQTWAMALDRKDVYEVEYRLRSREGSYRPFHCQAVPILGPDQLVREWIGTCTDLTERNLKAEMQRNMEAALASSQAKSEFLTKMSHELRTPLNAVIGMSRMLTTQRFGPLNAKQSDYLKDIISAGEHLLNLINDILDLAKVEAGKLEVLPETFDFRNLLEQLISTLHPLAEEKKLGLETIAPEGAIELFADPARLKQILYNLLSNAIKFTATGRVEVVITPLSGLGLLVEEVPLADAKALRIAVSDTGVGIPLDEQESVWGEFHQLRQTNNAAVQGTGLGLALTRGLVELLQGNVRLESTPGKGTTFTVEIPRHYSEDAQDVAMLSPIVPGQPLTLVIEDHAPTRKLLEDWLRHEGMAVIHAFDGVQGLQVARQLKPQLILLDIFLPKLDGWHVLTELKRSLETANIPVIVISVSEDRKRALSLGVQDYFVKPIDREMFLGRMRELQPHLFMGYPTVRALVVDDNLITRRLFKDWLEPEQIHVDEATDGREAIEKIRKHRPSVVLLDLLMPVLDGFDVVDAMRNNPEWRNIPIIVVTNKDIGKAERERLNGRIQAVMSKYHLTAEQLHEQLAQLGLSNQSLLNESE